MLEMYVYIHSCMYWGRATRQDTSTIADPEGGGRRTQMTLESPPPPSNTLFLNIMSMATNGTKWATFALPWQLLPIVSPSRNPRLDQPLYQQPPIVMSESIRTEPLVYQRG